MAQERSIEPNFGISDRRNRLIIRTELTINVRSKLPGEVITRERSRVAGEDFRSRNKWVGASGGQCASYVFEKEPAKKKEKNQ